MGINFNISHYKTYIFYNWKKKKASDLENIQVNSKEAKNKGLTAPLCYCDEL